MGFSASANCFWFVVVAWKAVLKSYLGLFLGLIEKCVMIREALALGRSMAVFAFVSRPLSLELVLVFSMEIQAYRGTNDVPIRLFVLRFSWKQKVKIFQSAYELRPFGDLYISFGLIDFFFFFFPFGDEMAKLYWEGQTLLISGWSLRPIPCC